MSAPQPEPGHDSTLTLILYRLAQIERKIDEQLDRLEEQINDSKDRIQRLELSQAQLAERLTIWQWAQGTYTTLAGILASFFGRS